MSRKIPDSRMDYAKQCLNTWNPDKLREDGHEPAEYLLAGLFSEIGELIQIWKRERRDGYQTEETWKKEAGDVLWYATVFEQETRELFVSSCDDMPKFYSFEMYFDAEAEYFRQAREIFRVVEPFPLQLVAFQHLLARMIANRDTQPVILVEYMIQQKLKMDLQEVRQINIAKLADRAARGVIQGKGDNR